MSDWIPTIMTMSAIAAIFSAHAFGKAQGKYELYSRDKTKDLGKYDTQQWQWKMKVNERILAVLVIVFFGAPLLHFFT